MSNLSTHSIKISVAMTTFNGCPFVKSQLESMAAQSLQPDEIIIGDDNSSDATEEEVYAFAQRHPKISVRFERNIKRLGTTKNFESVARKCMGEIIVFSDQDDLWMPNKLEKIVKTFLECPSVGYVFSNGLLINENNDLLKGELFSSIDFSRQEQEIFKSGNAADIFLRHNVVTGAALAVKRDLINRIFPLPDFWLHDYYIAFILDIWTGGILIDEPLIKYRCHRSQQVGVAGQGSFKKVVAYARKQNLVYCRQEAENFRALRTRLVDLGVPTTHPLFNKLHEKSTFFDLRARMREDPLSTPQLLWRSWRNGYYRRYALGWKQAVVDTLSAILALTPSSHRK